MGPVIARPGPIFAVTLLLNAQSPGPGTLYRNDSIVLELSPRPLQSGVCEFNALCKKVTKLEVPYDFKAKATSRMLHFKPQVHHFSCSIMCLTNHNKD